MNKIDLYIEDEEDIYNEEYIKEDLSRLIIKNKTISNTKIDRCNLTDSDYENTAQSVYISKPGNLYLVIKNETNVLQFFDVNTLDDEEYMKFKFTMYDIEEGYR